MIRLALDVSDPVSRRKLDDMFQAAHSIRRALQRGARARMRAYRAAHHERKRDPAALRERVGLSPVAFEAAARKHVNAAPHLRRHLTKAVAMHVADGVWNDTKRSLFADASGKRQGIPTVTPWHRFHRLVGRARSRTKVHVWESARLHGSLAGHRAAYTAPSGRFFQPRRMRPITKPRSWWKHAGPLVVVFTGLAGGDLALPVRLPSAPSNQPILDYLLGDPSGWHKIDLVRRRDRRGRWTYEAHLLVIAKPYVAPAAQARRIAAAASTAERCAGIDVNVSNVTIASHEGERDLRVTRVERSAGQRQRARRAARQQRRRQRDLDRSRRALNAQQYELSKRQAKRARRREAAALKPVQVIPMGPRRTRADGRPVQSYRRDHLSRSYRRSRAAMASQQAAVAQARREHAREAAGAIVAEHGCSLTMEDCNLSTWARRWGRSLAAFSPGTLVSAIDRESRAVAAIAGKHDGGIARASTKTTAMSQHCLCGERVSKSLGQRTHTCPKCGLHGNRDTIAAVLAAHVVFGMRSEPASATVDFSACRALYETLPTKTIDYRLLVHVSNGRQDAQTESTASTARDRFFVVETERTPDLVVVARRIVGMAPCPTPDEIGSCRTKPERARMRTNLSVGAHAPIWDSS